MAGADGGRRRADEREGRRRPAAGRRLGLVVALIVVVLLVGAGWLAVDAMRARSELTSAAGHLDDFQQAALSGDAAATASSLVSLQSDASGARAATHGPHWWLAARLPGVGPTVVAVQTVTDVVDGLALDALPALSDAVRLLAAGAFVPHDGRIDLDPFIDAAPGVVAAHAVVEGAAGRLDGIETDGIHPAVAGPVEGLRGSVGEAAMTTATAARAARLLPPMLGSQGPRRYLLLVQSNAEIRSTGGFAGALVVLTADEGEIGFDGKYQSSFLKFPESVLPLTEEEEAIYTSRMGESMFGTTITPDFPRAAELARAMWMQRMGEEVDGVLSVDPVALQHVLGRTGAVVTESGVRLTGENAARVLLNEVYLTVEGQEAQDLFFADAAQSVFAAFLYGRIRPVEVLPALARSAEEGRLLVWSAHEAEQDLLADTVLSGRLRGEDDGAPVVGVYLNDGSMSKISYYLDYDVRVERTACLPDGRREATVTVDMASLVPAGAAGLTRYAAGTGSAVPPGTMRTHVAVYAPEGGWIEHARVDGERVGIASYVHDGLALAIRTVDLAPLESTSVEMTLVTGSDQREPIRVRVTPGPRPSEVTVADSPCGQ